MGSLSLPILGLARLRVTPRLSRFSWRGLASTYPSVLHSTSPREVLFACPLSLSWNPHSFTAEFTLFSQYSPFLLPRCGSAAFFLLTKAALASLSTAHFVALRLPFPVRLAQFASVFPLKPAPFCMLSAGLGSTNKTAISLLSALPPFFILLETFLLRSGYNGLPDTHFLRGKTRLMSRLGGER